MPNDRLHLAPRTTRLERPLLACGVIGPPLFVVVFLVAGVNRPGYDPLRHPVSSLVLAEAGGWVQVANFLIAGALLLAFAVGLRQVWQRYSGGVWAARLTGLAAVGLIGSGIFPTAPISGYPPGTPMLPVRTVDGTLHDAFGTAIFFGLPIAFAVAARLFAASGHRRWAAYSVGTAALFVAFFVLSSMGFAQHSVLMPVGGLFQRLTLVIGLAWVAALAVYMLRQPTDAAAGRTADRGTAT